jgi:hypothetical protein
MSPRNIEDKMIRINATFRNPRTNETEERTFRTNNSGANLFTGVSSNRQISCESGFQDAKRMKKAIREHLRYEFDCDRGEPNLGRITYSV